MFDGRSRRDDSSSAMNGKLRSRSSSSKKSSPQMATDSDVERVEESLHKKFGITGEIGASSFPLVSSLCARLEQFADELESCQHQTKLLKGSNERLIRENEQLLRETEKKDTQIRELRAQVERLSKAAATCPEGVREGANGPLRQRHESELKDHPRNGDSPEMQKLMTLKDQVDTLQREKEFLERQLRTEKGEAGRKLEEFALSVNSSIKSVVLERESLSKKNKEYLDKLKEAQEENETLKAQLKQLKAEYEAIRNARTLTDSLPASRGSPLYSQNATSSPQPSSLQPSARDQELIKELENNIRMLTAELERTSLLVVEKDDLIKQMQHKAPQPIYESLEGPSQDGGQDLILQLHEKKKEKQRLEMELVEARTSIRTLEEERNRLNALLSDRTHRVDDYHETKTALGILEQKLQVQTDTLAARERELDRARKLIEEMMSKENHLQRTCGDLKFQVSSLSQQINHLNRENEDAGKQIRQLLADSNQCQKKLKKKETKLSYHQQILETKEKELQDVIVTSRRLNDLSKMLREDLTQFKEENASLNDAVNELKHKLQHLEASLRAEQQRSKRYEELFDVERKKAEELRDVQEHLQRHITKWGSIKEELNLLQRGNELRDNELQRLRKDNESLQNEKDALNERLRDLVQDVESARSMMELQDITIAKLEEEKGSLQDYVLKYEADLSKLESRTSQLTSDLRQLKEYSEFLEKMNHKMEELLGRMNDNVSDRDRLLQEFERLQRAKQSRGLILPLTPPNTTSPSSHYP